MQAAVKPSVSIRARLQEDFFYSVDGQKYSTIYNFETLRDSHEGAAEVRDAWMDLSVFKSVEYIHNTCRITLVDGSYVELYPLY